MYFIITSKYVRALLREKVHVVGNPNHVILLLAGSASPLLRTLHHAPLYDAPSIWLSPPTIGGSCTVTAPQPPTPPILSS